MPSRKQTAAEKLAAVTSVRERPDIQFRLSQATLIDESNKKLNWNIFDSCLSAPLELTIQGASTVSLEVEDPEYAFLNDPILAKWAFGLEDVSTSSARTWKTPRITSTTNTSRYGINSDWQWILGQRPVDIEVDGLWFRLCRVRTRQTKLTLSFEDRAASFLRLHRGVKTVTRGSVTRAGFVRMLCQEAKVPYFIPEVNVVQPIEESHSTSSNQRLSGGSGLTAGQVLVKGEKATEAQVKILNIALETAESLKAPFKAMMALVEALIQENDVSNPDPGEPNDLGCLSLIESTAQAMKINPFDIATVCNAFLTVGFYGNGGAISIAQGNSHMSAGEVAQAVQGSAFPTAYGKWAKEAEEIVRAFFGGGSGKNTASNPSAYSFTRGDNETSWDCIQRLASEVQWYAFARENVLWFVSGDYLFAQKPQLHVEQGAKGIRYVDVDLDVGARDSIAEVEVEAETEAWTALPGMIARVVKRGPADGNWMVATALLNLLDEAQYADIKLQKPLPPRAEPAQSSSATTTGFGEGQSSVAAYNAAQALSQMELPYLWGGGHSSGGLENVHKGGPGLDCSGSVCWVLKQVGMFNGNAAIDSGELEKWGEPGEGAEMTVWCNAEHTWIEFKINGKSHGRLDTVGAPGPRLQGWPPPEGTTGFTARHWPGT